MLAFKYIQGYQPNNQKPKLKQSQMHYYSILPIPHSNKSLISVPILPTIMIYYLMIYGSAALDIEVVHVSDQANAGPAFRFHLVEVFETGEVSSSIRSTSFSSLLADGVGSTNVINTGHLLSLCALLGVSEDSQKSEQGKNEHGLHGDYL